MDFGMPTLIENKNLLENIALCKELKLNFIELNMNFPEYQIEQLEQMGLFVVQAKNAGIYFTIHLEEELDIANFNAKVASAYFETVRRAIQVAKSINAPIINMHLNHGIHITLPDKKVELYELYQKQYRQSFMKFITMCEKEIAFYNIKICIENTDGFRDFEKDIIKSLLSSSVFALTFDIGHSHAVSNVDEAFLLENKNHLKHFHIHDAKGTANHLTLGTGEINLRERLSLAKQLDCRCVLETKTIEALRQSKKWIQENFA